MDRSTVRTFIRACQEAAHIVRLLPELPAPMTPRHVAALDAVHELSQETAGRVCVSDVSDWLGVTRPSVTRMLSELERLGLLEKEADRADKRVVWVRLTQAGEAFYEFYVYRYHGWLGAHFSEEDAAEFLAAADTIHRFYHVMSEETMDMAARPSLPAWQKGESNS